MPTSFSPASIAPCTAPAAAPLIIFPSDLFAFLTMPDEATFFAPFFTLFAVFDAAYFADFAADFFFFVAIFYLCLLWRPNYPTKRWWAANLT